MNAEILLISPDLMFTSKVTGTATAVGRRAAVAPNLDSALGRIDDETQIVIVDLGMRPPLTTDQLSALRARLDPEAQLIAYGSHVDVDLLESAAAAGCDPVLPRSEFVRRLPELLKGT